MVEEKELKQEEVQIKDLANWTDEQCQEFDKEMHFTATNVRDLALSCMNAIQNFNSIYAASEQFKQFVTSGKMLGYTISCPKCKVTYNVNAPDLHYNEEITCQDCGEKYIQNNNIVGLYVRDEAVEDAK